MFTYRPFLTFLRLVFFVAAAAVLAWRCRAGTSPIEVAVLVVLYVVAATLWVRGQHQGDVDAVRAGDDDLRPWRPPIWVALLATSLAAYVAYLGVKHDRGSALLFGTIAAYLSAGYVVMSFRLSINGSKALQSWAPPVKVSVVSAVVAGVAAYWAWTTGHDIAALVPGVIVLFALILVIERLRVRLHDVDASTDEPEHLALRLWRWTEPARRVRPFRIVTGCIIAVTSLSLVVIGLLDFKDGTAGVASVAVGLLIAPISMSVLAEPILRALSGAGATPKSVGFGLAGAVLYGLMMLWAVRMASTNWVAVTVLIVLGLLILAIVSDTQADIAVIIAVVCLMGVTSDREPKPSALTPEPGQKKVLVALGDSYMSGEGARIFYEEDNDSDHANHCNRAPTAWAALAGQADRNFDSVEFLACSGARTFNVRHETKTKTSKSPRPQFNEPATQLDQYDDFEARMSAGGEPFVPKLTVISLGGNDAGFSTIGAMCLAPGDCYDQRDLWEKSLDQVETALKETFAEVSAEFPRSPVLVVPYPSPIFTNDTGDPVRCKQVTLSKQDLKFITEFLPKLNQRVHAAATSQHFYFLDTMQDALARAHVQLCDPANASRPGLNFIGLRSVGGLAEQRFNPTNWYHNSLHPNERGHAAMRQVFEDWLAERQDPENGSFLPRTTQRATQAAARQDAARNDGGPPSISTKMNATNRESVVTETPCDLLDEQNPSNCRSEGIAWARGQVAHKLIWDWWGLLVALAALGAWLMSLALLGTWKFWWGPRPSPGQPTPDVLPQPPPAGDPSA